MIVCNLNVINYYLNGTEKNHNRISYNLIDIVNFHFLHFLFRMTRLMALIEDASVAQSVFVFIGGGNMATAMIDGCVTSGKNS